MIINNKALTVRIKPEHREAYIFDDDYRPVLGAKGDNILHVRHTRGYLYIVTKTPDGSLLGHDQVHCSDVEILSEGAELTPIKLRHPLED